MMTFFSATNGSRSVGEDDDLAAGKALAAVVVGVAFESHRDAAREKRAEALAGGAGEPQADRVVGQAGRSVLPRHFAAEDRADGAMDVANREVQLNRFAPLDGRERTSGGSG